MQCDEVLSIFPKEIRELVQSLHLSPDGLQEIRIRAGRPILIRYRNRELVTGRTVSRDRTAEILAYLGSYSLYAYEAEIRQGFLSLPGGHRVGLSGKAVMEAGRVKTLGEISSLNIRFAHQIRGCADPLERSACLCPRRPWPPGWRTSRRPTPTPPGRGKTTLLRDCIRQISDGSDTHPGKTVGVVDERSEIAGCFRGVPGNDVGMRTDVLDGCPKAEGMMMLIRSMAPDVVAVDEIGGREDAGSLRYAMNCGCVLLATVHGSCMEELLQKPVLRELVEQGIFERYVFLEAGKIPGRIGQILDRQGESVC